MQRHDRVALPLPGVAVTLKWTRPKPYAENPRTLAEHILKKRLEAGLTQAEAAGLASVKTWTLRSWEKGQRHPNARVWPRVLMFLGYDPNSPAHTLADQIAQKRRELGLTIKEAANLIGVDEGTFKRWESGEWRPKLSENKVRCFLKLVKKTLAGD